VTVFGPTSLAGMFSLAEPALFTRLRDSRSVLIAGAGGGFDVYGGLPLALALRAQGKAVHLANLSFSHLDSLDLSDWAEPGVAAVHPESASRSSYFPERALAAWLAAEGLPATVYAFERTGVAPLRAAYRALIRRLEADAIVLVDGGTDILMRGDEAGLGTPEEDMSSLAAVSALSGVPERLVACLGFGIDAYHGVCHAHVLENIAGLEREGAYLGAFSIPGSSAEALAYRKAVRRAHEATPLRPSIVHGQIAAALAGEFGDVHASDRTAGSELFVNPLMGIYFTFDLPGLARSVQYLHRLADTQTLMQVRLTIEEHRNTITPRPRRPIPH
jgi:hypothetical protein